MSAINSDDLEQQNPLIGVYPKNRLIWAIFPCTSFARGTCRLANGLENPVQRRNCLLQMSEARLSFAICQNI